MSKSLSTHPYAGKKRFQNAEVAPADHAARAGQEGGMDDGVAFPADPEAAEVVQPGEGALTDPAPAAQPRAVLGAAAAMTGSTLRARRAHFNRSSQRLIERCCDEQTQATVGAGRSAGDAVTVTPACGAEGAPSAVLGGDRAGCPARTRRSKRACRARLVSGGSGRV